MSKEFWKALLMRSIHAVWETAVATLPAAIVVTPAMIAQFNWETAMGIFYAVAAWALSAIFAGVLSAAKSMKVGMPEVQLSETLYALDNEPDEEDEELDAEYPEEDDEEGDE